MTTVTPSAEKNLSDSKIEPLSNQNKELFNIKNKVKISEQRHSFTNELPSNPLSTHRVNIEKKGEAELKEEKDPLDGLDPLLVKYRIALPEVPPTYRTGTHEFGVNIEKLLFANVKHTLQNMEYIAAKEGFELIPTGEAYYPRDNLCLIGKNQVVIGTCPLDDLARQRALSRSIILREGGFVETAHPFFRGSPGITSLKAEAAKKDCGKILPSLKTFNSLYLEGGDYYLINGCLLLGEQFFYINLNIYRLNKIFDKKECQLERRTNKINLSLTTSEIDAALKEMYAQGLIKTDTCNNGFLSVENLTKILMTPSSLRGEDFLKAAKDANFYTPLTLKQGEAEKNRMIVAKYLAQKQILLEIIATHFCVKKENVLLLPSCHPHLDFFMRPGPKNSVFFQSHPFTVDVLKSLQKSGNQLQLTKKDHKILEEHIQTSETLSKDLGPLVTRAESILRAAGFTIIPTPAYFQGLSRATNFMNAVSGHSQTTGHYYYITFGSQLGDRLGPSLMNMFRRFLTTYQPGIQVYFVGYDPDHPNDFSAAESFTIRETFSGVHCLSTEIVTTSNVSNKEVDLMHTDSKTTIRHRTPSDTNSTDSISSTVSGTTLTTPLIPNNNTRQTRRDSSFWNWCSLL